jgi:hypothetical protein
MDLVGQAGLLSADIRYTSGHFTISTWVHSGPASVPREMTEEEIATLHRGRLQARSDGLLRLTFRGPVRSALGPNGRAGLGRCLAPLRAGAERAALGGLRAARSTGF